MPRNSRPITHKRFDAKIPCTAKRSFRSELDAQVALEIASLRDMSLSLRYYKCPYCGQWHLSSSNQNATELGGA